jgi:NAD-dependent SIR2 family protein deacetylase
MPDPPESLPGLNPDIARAAKAIADADVIIVGAGAGMGVDSGMPDFRSADGFWGNYPLLNGKRLDVLSMCNPDWFRNDPAFAWGFYGHRLNMYRDTPPHAGFEVLAHWVAQSRRGGFVYTSNIDSHFQKSGFHPSRIFEVHGSLQWLQCMDNCGIGLFTSDGLKIEVDEALHVRGPLPRCRACGALARPNIVLYGDDGFDSSRSNDQRHRMDRYLQGIRGARAVVLEFGAGMTIPTVRDFCEDTARNLRGTFIRVNKSECSVPPDGIAIEMGAKAALLALNAALGEMQATK